MKKILIIGKNNYISDNFDHLINNNDIKISIVVSIKRYLN